MTDPKFVDVWNGFIQGIKDWNGHGGLTVVESTSSPVSLTIACLPLDGNIALFHHNPNARTQVSNLPVGPHGGDPGAAQQYDGGSIVLRPDVIDVFGCDIFNDKAKRIAMGRLTGRHEMGHAVGFDHTVAAGLMSSQVAGTCTQQSIPASYDLALTHYKGTKNNSVFILLDSLPH